jgi:glycosyltransferase involved in cell wall biosynthesis
VVYEVIDHLGVFPNRRLVAREHPRLLRLAEVVVTTSEALWSEAARTRPDTLLSSNGVDYEEVRAAIRSPGRPPEDLQALVEAGKPLVGYYGALARWLDYDLLLQVALKRPDLEFLLIGPNFDGSLRALQTQPLANLHWIGPRPPDVLLGYLRYFDATMIPFRVDPLTDAASPLKLFEYMAAGKPVVATPTQELRRFAEVFTGRDPDGFSQAIDQALAARGDDGYLARLDRVAREHDWSQIARPILERLGIGREGKAEGR